jgi:glycerol-3-phosphate acyltransferase PlsY
VDPWHVVAVVAGYLIGSIDFGVIVPRLAGVDIYEVGSGNPGTTNVLRSMGRGAAAAVLAGDFLKGLAAAAIGTAAGPDPVGYAAGFGAAAGHCYPLWHRFRGGKGVATTGGAVLWMAPLVGGILAAAWALLTVAWRKASPASLILAVVLVPSLAVAGRRGWSLAWAGAASLLIAWRHRGNIARLVQGSEHSIEEAP